eukprot:5516324-Ditylum_brightwellii.AAC.1
MGVDPIKDPRTVERWFVDFGDSEAVVEVIDGNLGDIPLDIAHDYMNKCLNAIMENDELFQSDIKTENESDDDNDGSTPI